MPSSLHNLANLTARFNSVTYQPVASSPRLSLPLAVASCWSDGTTLARAPGSSGMFIAFLRCSTFWGATPTTESHQECP